MSTSKIKIVIPIYNTELYLKRCIESLLSQTFSSYEIVLVDDGSTDNCSEICDAYSLIDERIHVIHQENRGLSAARNSGIDYPLPCDYITFVDSDDWVHQRYLEILHKIILQTGTRLSICSHVRTNGLVSNTEVTGSAKVYSAEDCYCLKSVSTIPAWGKLYDISLFSRLRFPVDKIHEDHYVSWKILFQLDAVSVTEDPLYYYYYNPEGIMHSEWNPHRMDIFGAFEEQIMYFRENGYHKAEQRAMYRYFRTIEKYLAQVINTEYEEAYLPKLRELENKHV